MRAHVGACAPLEACGLLIGSGEVVSEVRAILNAAQSAVRFRMEPAQQLHAFRDIEDRKLELLGVFHSHPAAADSDSLRIPSETDIREAAYPVVHVIWHRQGGQWQGAGFWIEADRITEVPLDVEADE